VDSDASAPNAAPAAPSVRARLAKAIAIYTLLRLGLMAVITAGLMFVMPLIVALAFAVVLQLPIAILLFPRVRRELLDALAESRAEHHAERDRLRAELMGERGQRP
jgi:hypothetical protein